MTAPVSLPARADAAPAETAAVSATTPAGRGVQSPYRTRTLARMAAGATAAVIALWSIRVLFWPLGFDQGEFVWVGDIIRHGGLPYRDAWDTKGPLAYYLGALARLLFGRNEWGVRAFDLLVFFAGLKGVAVLARRWGGDRAAALSACGVLALRYATLDYNNTAQPDGWAGVMLVGAALAMSGDSRRAAGRLARFALAGALIGGTTLVKPTYGLFLLAPAAYAAAEWSMSAGDPKRHGRLASSTLATGVGFAMTIAGAVLWFAAHGALDAFLDVHLRWTTAVYAGTGTPWLLRVVEIATAWLAGPFAITLPFVVVGAVTLWARRRAAACFTLAWLVAAVANTAVQGKFFLYHWLPLYAPHALLAGFGLAVCYQAARRDETTDATATDLAAGPTSPVRVLYLAAAGVLWCSIALGPVYDLYRWAKAELRPQTRAEYWQREFGLDGWQPDSWHGIERYIVARTRAGDPVLLLGGNPGRLAIADRRFPGRFGIALPLILGEGKPVRDTYRREFLAALRATPPVYVVRARPDVCERERWAGYHCVRDFPELDSLLARDYHPETVIAGRDLLRRNP